MFCIDRLAVGWTIIILLVTIKVDGWRVVFKVSEGGDVSPATTVYNLWNDSYVANPAGFYHANLTYMAPYQPTYKSEIVNQWEQHGIAYVKVGLYKSGMEKYAVVFNGTNTNKSSWFNRNLVLQPSEGDLNSTGQNKFDLQGLFGIGRFLALEETIYNCTEAKGWFLVVDTDVKINCQCDYCRAPNITVPYFIYAPNGLSSRITSGEEADSFVIFVDDCAVNSCQHDGTCTPYIDGYSCQCVDQIYGPSCQYKCPCIHGGKCYSVGNNDIQNDGAVVIDGALINDQAITLGDGTKVACQCPQYFSGANCSINTLQCSSSPCYNYGSCIEGYTSYTCRCNHDYTGDRCQNARPPPKEKGLNTGAKAALGVCIPLVVIIGLVIGYFVYLLKNPDAYGHEATNKQYTIAREFVRRSIRRISGKRSKQSDETKDTAYISPKEKEVNTGQINLAFEDGGKVKYGRQNSEYFNMSADDNAVMSGKTMNYPVNNKNSEHGREDTRKYLRPGPKRSPGDYAETNSPRDYGSDNAFNKEYRPELYGGDNNRYTHPGHKYDEYNSNDYQTSANPVPQPRNQQRQTGRRGRPDINIDNQTYSQDVQIPPKVVISEKGGGYDGQVLSKTPRSRDNTQHDDNQIQSPRSDQSRPYVNYSAQQSRRSPDEIQKPPSTRFSQGYNSEQKFPEQYVNDSRISPGYPQNSPGRYIEESRRPPSYTQQPKFPDRSVEGLPHRRTQHIPDRSTENSRHSPSYKHDVNSRPYNDSSSAPVNRQENYSSRPAHEHNQRSARPPVDSYDRYYEQGEQHSVHRPDDRIVFTSSEPMDDVTV